MELVKTPERRSQETDAMQYPTPSEVEQSLKRFAEEIGDTTESRFALMWSRAMAVNRRCIRL